MEEREETERKGEKLEEKEKGVKLTAELSRSPTISFENTLVFLPD